MILEFQDAGYDLVVFPEISLIGYLDPTVHDDHFATLGSPQILELIKFGVSRSVEWLFGILHRAPSSKPYITQIHASGGAVTGVYRKRNLATLGRHSYQNLIRINRVRVE